MTRSAGNGSRLYSITSCREQCRGHGEAKRFRGLEVDDKLNFCGLNHRQVGRLFALEDATSIDADLTECIVNIGPIAHEASSWGEPAESGGRWHGSPAVKKMIGMVEVAACSASTEGVLSATITASLRPTKSVAKAGIRSFCYGCALRVLESALGAPMQIFCASGRRPPPDRCIGGRADAWRLGES